MQMIVGAAAMTAGAKPLSAKKLAQSAKLADLIGTFRAANKTLELALADVEKIEEEPAPAVRVFSGMTGPLTLVMSDRTEVFIPASEWFFHSGDQISEDLKKSLDRASASEHEAIRERYSGYWSEYVKQHQTIKKATSAKRKAEAAVEKVHRAERRALRAILDYEPSSANEALLLLEFAMAEEALGGNDDLRTVMATAARALRMTIAGEIAAHARRLRR
jgi:hypothetical protein